MFGWLKRKSQGHTAGRNGAILPKVPLGFAPYAAGDFAAQFGVSESVAIKVASDYFDILHAGEKGIFGAEVRASPRDGARVGTICSERYGVRREDLSGIVRFFMFVAIAIEQQAKMQALNIVEAEWIESGAAIQPCHPGLDGRRFNPQQGLLIGEGYVLPGVTFGCKCMSRPIMKV